MAISVNDNGSIFTNAETVSSQLADDAITLVQAIDSGGIITTTSSAAYKQTIPNPGYFKELPPDEPQYPAFDSFVPPVLDSIDMYLTYTSDFLASVQDYLMTSGDGLSNRFVNDTSALEDSRNSMVASAALGRMDVVNDLFPWPDQDVSGVCHKLSEEYSFEQGKVERQRRIDSALRVLDHAKFVVSQGVEIEKALMMFGPESALEQAKAISIEAEAYASAITAIGVETDALVSFFKAQISAYSTRGRISQSEAESALSRDTSYIALNKCTAAIANLSDRINLENQANRISLYQNATASKASVSSHGAAGAMAAAYISTNSTSSKSQGYQESSSTSYSTNSSTSTADVTKHYNK